MIYQTFHKEFPRNEDCLWVKPLSVNNFKMDGKCSDGDGENIASLNPFYCELTAQYWAWKNTNSSFVGFYHYRRYLNFLNEFKVHDNASLNLSLTPNIIDYLTSDAQYKKLTTLLSITEVIIPKKMLCIPSIAGQYLNSVNHEPWNLFVSLLKIKYSSVIDAETFFENVLEGSICNIFIMKRDIFNKYCADLFEIVNPIYSVIGSKYDHYNNRYPGFLAERFLGFWLHVNKISYIEVPMIVIE
jgi:hypothetical protein